MPLLNTADAVYLGSQTVDAVYLGATKVWEKATAGGPWTPAEISEGMFGWYDAAEASSLTFSGANLLEWADQGPANRPLVRQGASGPTLTGINGLGALAFVPGQSLNTVNATSFNDFTVVVVFKPGTMVSTYERLVDHIYGSGWWFGRTGGTQTWGGGVQEGPPNYGIFVPLTDNEAHQIASIRADTTHTVRGDGGAGLTSNTVTNSGTVPARVYVADDNNVLSPIAGVIAEVILWSRALPVDELEKTEGYLAWKWGIQAKLPVAHPYKAAAPSLGPPPFGPADLAGLTVWLDASQLALADGASVSPWPDLSGAGHHGAIVGTPAPVVRANALKGQRVVRFKMNEGRVRGNNGLTGALGPYNFTVIYLSRMVGPGVGRIYSGLYPAVNFALGYYSGGWDTMYMGGFYKPDTAWTTLPTPWRLYAATASHDGATYLSGFYQDGVLQGSNAGTDSAGTAYNLSGYSASGTEETCDGEVAEVVVYNRRLTDAERAQVEDYLRTKWL